jgi:hypothetical protein
MNSAQLLHIAIFGFLLILFAARFPRFSRL